MSEVMLPLVRYEAARGEIVVIFVPVNCTAPDNEVAPVAPRVVNEPAAAVLCPMEVLFIVLAAVGLMVRAPTGEIATVPVPDGEIATAAEAGERVTAPVAPRVVAWTARGVVTPRAILSIAPAVFGLIVTVPVVVGERVTAAPTGERVTAPLAPNAVNDPAAAVLWPIEVLLMVLAAVGLTVSAPAGEIVTVPVPVGEITTAALAGERVTAPDAPNVVKLPVPMKVLPTPLTPKTPQLGLENSRINKMIIRFMFSPCLPVSHPNGLSAACQKLS